VTTDVDVSTADATFEAQLNPDSLSALMRSTWTWDDRALRRDLSDLLVAVTAARARRQSAGPDDAIGATLHYRALSSGAAFAASVLGPAIIADTGNALRSQFVSAASDPAQFNRRTHVHFADVLEGVGDYFTNHLRALEYAPESQWRSLVYEDGRAGLNMTLRACGHQLSDSPWFANMALVWQTLDAAGTPSAASHARAVREGQLSATLAAAEASGSWDPALVRTKATRVADEWRLTGTKFFVPAAGDAEKVYVIARSLAGPTLFAVDGRHPTLTVSAQETIDSTRPLYALTFTDTPAELIGIEGAGGRLMSEALDLVVTALAAEQVGLIESALAILRTQLAYSTDAPWWAGEAVLRHAAAESLWRQALADNNPESAAAAHIGCSAAAVWIGTLVAQLCPDSQSTVILRRALSGSLWFGGPALSHERLLERLGI
jgi:alkylation response protein AidB-like acyl-CoA dehydrogenase